MADPLRPSGPQIPGSLMGEIQSEVAVEATPLLSFVLRNSRIIVTCIVLLVLVIAGVGGWQWHQTRVEREAHLELGRILVSTQGPERIAALETFLPAAPSAMKSGVQLEIATTALGLEQYGKAADAYAAVAAADDQHILHMGMDGHGHMGHHLIINKLIFFREYDLPVQGNKLSKLLGVKHIDPLIFAFSGKKLFFDPDRKLYVSRMQL